MSVAEVTGAAEPAAPRTLEEAGLNIDLVTQLALKTLHLAGTLTGLELANRMGADAVAHPSATPPLSERTLNFAFARLDGVPKGK